MFGDLDEMANLRCLRPMGASGDRRRRLVGGCNDAVTDLLAGCQTAGELAGMAYRFGVGQAEIRQRAASAASFGQFRLVIGNRIRGIVRRLDRARRDGRGMSLAAAARTRPRRASALVGGD